MSEVTQPRRSRVRILTNKAAMVGKMIRNKETWSKEALRSGLRVWWAHRPSSEADPSLFGSMGWTGKNKGRRRRKLSLGLLNVFPYPCPLSLQSLLPNFHIPAPAFSKSPGTILCRTLGLTRCLHLSLSNRADGRWYVDTSAPCSLSPSVPHHFPGLWYQAPADDLLINTLGISCLLHSPTYAA